MLLEYFIIHLSTQDTPSTNEENEFNDQYLNNGSANHVHVDNDSSDHDLHELVRINSKVFSSHPMFLFPP
jgi:hypothetical protein